MSVESKLVERLHAVLVEEIRSRRPQYLQQPFTVAEIYQDLVPYRSHRDRIGASMNGDYEHALLKLLAGEGNYVVLESEQARKRLLTELESSNPNTGIFRDYAALDVWLNPARIPADAPAPTTAPEAAPAPEAPSVQAVSAAAEEIPAIADLSWELALAEKPAAMKSDVKPQKAATRSETRTTPAVAAKRSVPRPATGPAASPSNCRWCKSELPKREGLRFCPFCGEDVHLVPCSSCGERLESGWRFCIVCGTPTPEEA